MGGGLVVGLQAFAFYDWGHGGVRFALLMAIAALAFAGSRVLGHRSRVADDARGAGLIGVVVLSAALVLAGRHASTGIRSALKTARTGAIEQDQGQINARAVGLSARGVNPYGRRTMLTPHQYLVELARPETAACLGVPPQPMVGHLRRFWVSRDPAAMAALFPAISPEPRCARVRARFDAFGYAYGPFLLQIYRPFIRAFGDAGIYVSHVACFLDLCGVLIALARRFGGGEAFVVGLPLLLVLVPEHVATTTLVQSCCDLAGVFLAVCGFLLVEQGRAAAAAVCIGLSVACKLFPGALYLPLLLGAGGGRRYARPP